MIEILVVGKGNLAWHLVNIFKNRLGISTSVFVREKTPDAIDFANGFNVDLFTKVDELKGKFDIVFLAVSDNAIQFVADQFNEIDSLLVHAAGAVNMDVFNGIVNNYGVFYLLQSFTKEVSLDYSNIPVLIEANNKENLSILNKLASKFSETILECDSKHRLWYHLLAVIGNNFTNHMFHIINDICKKESLEYNLLSPIIAETFNKITKIAPAKAQTGPALRDNQETMEKHLELLNQYSEYATIYKLLSKSIKDLNEDK